MASIITRLFGRYLALFVKQFNGDQLSLSFLGGKGEMRNVELNEDAINELLNMPNMRVKRIHCNRVSAMASLTKLGSKPVTLFIDRCEVDLEEPAEFVAPTAILEALMQKMKAKEGAKKKMYGFGDRIGDGIRVEIGSLRISVGMQGAHKTVEIGEWTPPTLRINVRNVVVASTTSSWKEADLDKIWQQENKGKPEIRVCKRVVCESVSLSLLPSAWKTAATGAQPVVLFTDLPVVVNLIIRKTALGGAALSLEAHILISKVVLKLQPKDLASCVHFFLAAWQCFHRDDIHRARELVQQIPTAGPKKGGAFRTKANTVIAASKAISAAKRARVVTEGAGAFESPTKSLARAASASDSPPKVIAGSVQPASIDIQTLLDEDEEVLEEEEDDSTAAQVEAAQKLAEQAASSHLDLMFTVVLDDWFVELRPDVAMQVTCPTGFSISGVEMEIAWSWPKECGLKESIFQLCIPYLAVKVLQPPAAKDASLSLLLTPFVRSSTASGFGGKQEEQEEEPPFIHVRLVNRWPLATAWNADLAAAADQLHAPAGWGFHLNVEVQPLKLIVDSEYILGLGRIVTQGLDSRWLTGLWSTKGDAVEGQEVWRPHMHHWNVDPIVVHGVVCLLPSLDSSPGPALELRIERVDVCLHPWLPCPSWRSKQPHFPADHRRLDESESGNTDDNLPETVEWIAQRLDTLKFSVRLQGLNIYVLPSHQENIADFEPMVSIPKVEISGCASLLLEEEDEADGNEAAGADSEECIRDQAPAFSWMPRFVVTTYLDVVKVRLKHSELTLLLEWVLHAAYFLQRLFSPDVPNELLQRSPEAVAMALRRSISLTSEISEVPIDNVIPASVMALLALPFQFSLSTIIETIECEFVDDTIESRDVLMSAKLHGINMVAKGKRDPDSQRHFMAMTADGLVVESGSQCLCRVVIDEDAIPFFQFRAVLQVPSDPPPQLSTRLLLRNLRLCVDMPQLSKLAVFLFTAVPPELSAIIKFTVAEVAPAIETVVATILHSIMVPPVLLQSHIYLQDISAQLPCADVLQSEQLQLSLNSPGATRTKWHRILPLSNVQFDVDSLTAVWNAGAGRPGFQPLIVDGTIMHEGHVVVQLKDTELDSMASLQVSVSKDKALLLARVALAMVCEVEETKRALSAAFAAVDTDEDGDSLMRRQRASFVNDIDPASSTLPHSAAIALSRLIVQVGDAQAAVCAVLPHSDAADLSDETSPQPDTGAQKQSQLSLPPGTMPLPEHGNDDLPSSPNSPTSVKSFLLIPIAGISRLSLGSTSASAQAKSKKSLGKRWCVVFGQFLRIYKDPKGVQFLEISLQDVLQIREAVCGVDADCDLDPDDALFGFVVVTSQKATTQVFFAESDQLRSKWINSLLEGMSSASSTPVLPTSSSSSSHSKPRRQSFGLDKGPVHAPSPLEVAIQFSHLVAEPGQKPFIQFVLSVRLDYEQWHVPTRFSDVLDLHSKIKKALSKTAPKTIPASGKKLESSRRATGNNLDPKFISSRRSMIDEYLKELCLIPTIAEHELVLAFLHVESSQHVVSKDVDNLLAAGSRDTKSDLSPTDNLEWTKVMFCHSVTGQQSVIPAVYAAFGPHCQEDPIVADLIYAHPSDCSKPLTNAEAVKGSVLLAEFGVLDYTTQALVAQKAGAIAMILVAPQNIAMSDLTPRLKKAVQMGAAFTMMPVTQRGSGYIPGASLEDRVQIPCMMVSAKDGLRLKTMLPGVQAALQPDSAVMLNGIIQFGGPEGLTLQHESQLQAANTALRQASLTLTSLHAEASVQPLDPRHDLSALTSVAMPHNDHADLSNVSHESLEALASATHELQLVKASEAELIDRVNQLEQQLSETIAEKDDAQKQRVAMETYENQRRYPIKGWSESLMLTDRHKWSDRSGGIRQPRDGFDLVPGWDWVGEWAYDTEGNVDSQGWEYALDFNTKYTFKESWLTSVRRRRWLRTMVQVDGSVSTPAPTFGTVTAVNKRAGAAADPTADHMAEMAKRFIQDIASKEEIISRLEEETTSLQAHLDEQRQQAQAQARADAGAVRGKHAEALRYKAQLDLVTESHRQLESQAQASRARSKLEEEQRRAILLAEISRGDQYREESLRLVGERSSLLREIARLRNSHPAFTPKLGLFKTEDK